MNSVLAQKLGLGRGAPEPPPDTPNTPMRQMRRALGRAADKAVGLSASVLGIAEEDVDAEALIDDGPDGWVVLGLRDGSSAGLSGVFLMDAPLRSALVEMQTMGNLLPAAADQRRVTQTDAVMSVPFASQLLRELADVGFGADALDPASYDIGPIENLRTAGLVMVQGIYRSWRITIQMGGGDAQGEMQIAMRLKAPAPVVPVKDGSGWSQALRSAVQDAPADLDAVLTRMMLSIDKIEAFEVGQVIELAGTTVGSVTLTGPGGEGVATARLGQVAGKRAVRIQPLEVELQEDPPKMAVRKPLPQTDLVDSTAQPDVVAPELPKDEGTPTDLVEG